MNLDDVTDANAVQSAVNEFERIGQTAFLGKYGFGSLRGWMLRTDDGKEYDAKAILGAAHGYQYPDQGPLTQDQFHGGQPTARQLRSMGFTVTEPSGGRNPVWSRDELILALNLYMQHRPSFPDDKHPEVIELSGILNLLAAKAETNRVEKFRNPNGVAMKLQNFRRFDPDQAGKGLQAGGKGEEDVWAIFSGDPVRLATTAAAIRDAATSSDTSFAVDEDDGDDAEEGRILTRLHRTRERDKGIVERRKALALKEHGVLRCEACQFDFSARYGSRGTGFIECHHTKPISALRAGDRTKITDLVLLCANCHRMIHVARPWLSVKHLPTLLGPR